MNGAPFRIGLLGFGTVGGAVARRLAGPDGIPGLVLTHVCDRRAAGKRAAWHADGRPAAGIVWTSDISDLLTSDVDAVVEAIGGLEPADEWLRAALRAGKSVVTANKQVMAHEGPSLARLAARQGRQLRYEAAVGGAMPIIALLSALDGDRVRGIEAILNGTTNAVLSRIDETGCSFAAALAEARVRGWAEADAALDVDGIDARAKLALLCAAAFRVRVRPEEIDVRTSRHVHARAFEEARRAGATIRQLACAAYCGASRTLTAWVAPAVVPRESVLGRTRGPRNAAVVRGEFAGEIEVTGVGAGGDATAVAIPSDLLAIARDRAAVVPAPALERPARIAGISRQTMDHLFERSRIALCTEAV